MLSDTSRFFFCVWKWRFFLFRLVFPFLENVMPRKICRPIETSIDVDFFSSFRWSITISIRSINLDGIKIHLHCEFVDRIAGTRMTHDPYFHLVVLSQTIMYNRCANGSEKEIHSIGLKNLQHWWKLNNYYVSFVHYKKRESVYRERMRILL